MAAEVIHEVPKLIIQLSVILLAAKISGEITERLLKVPGVLGELVAGMIIGPYALGGVSLPYVGPLFFPGVTQGHGAGVAAAIPGELYFLAQLAAIILLFLSGLETDLRLFLRYVYPSLASAIGGVFFPFVFGVLATVLMGVGKGFLSPEALFIGAVMTATSVGITARVLNKLKKTNSPEGVTILAAAMVDDVLGILILAAVVMVSTLGSFDLKNIVLTGAKSIGFLGGLIFFGYVLARHMDFFLKRFETKGSGLVIPLGFCFIAAALAEFFGLAMIIGAFVVGLALSSANVSSHLEEQLAPVYHIFVPIFFVVMGMLVDFRALGGILLFGLLITALAIVGKVLGSGLPALLVGFNVRGGLRIGLGMMPRGEVALIIAGVGVSAGVIGQEIYSVAVLLTLVTAAAAPVLLVRALQYGGAGLRAEKMGDAAFQDVCALEDPDKYHFQFEKEWDVRVAEEWRNHFLRVLERGGLKRIRGIHGAECHLFTFQDRDNHFYSISENREPETNRVATKIYGTGDAIHDYIRRTDEFYNEKHRVSFFEGISAVDD
jgi:Kef-type K+ transport system membrane component KefB